MTTIHAKTEPWRLEISLNFWSACCRTMIFVDLVLTTNSYLSAYPHGAV